MSSRYPCTFWMIRSFDNPLRRFFQNPRAILDGLVKEGQTVIDIGCAIGYFSLAMARMVGAKGTVIAVDVNPEPLKVLQHRAAKAGMEERIKRHACTQESLGVSEHVDFALAFWMVHEVPDQAHLFQEIHSLLNPEAHLLMVEPKVHVSRASFEDSVKIAEQNGFVVRSRPDIGWSRAVLFGRA